MQIVIPLCSYILIKRLNLNKGTDRFRYLTLDLLASRLEVQAFEIISSYETKIIQH